MIDSIASQPHYAAHLDPVMASLPDELHGDRVSDRTGRVHDAVLVSSVHDLTAARRLEYPRIAYLEHGIGQSYSSTSAGYPGGKGRDAVGLFLSPNGTAAARDRATYPDARIVLVGDPRLDTLPALEAAPGTVAVSFHWQCNVAPETRPAFPHYRAVLPDLAAAVPLIAHAHPRASSSMRRVYERLGIEFVESFDEVCRRASLYVCDNSSTLFEFASTGRPVVVLNAPWYRRATTHGLRFWDAAMVGDNVSGPDELIPAVQLALMDLPPWRERREAALSIAYAFRSGAAQRAADAIAAWLRDRQEVAA